MWTVPRCGSCRGAARRTPRLPFKCLHTLAPRLLGKRATAKWPWFLELPSLRVGRPGSGPKS